MGTDAQPAPNVAPAASVVDPPVPVDGDASVEVAEVSEPGVDGAELDVAGPDDGDGEGSDELHAAKLKGNAMAAASAASRMVCLDGVNNVRLLGVGGMTAESTEVGDRVGSRCLSKPVHMNQYHDDAAQ